MRNGIFPATSWTRMSQSQWLQSPQKVSWWAPRELRKTNTCHLVAIRLQPLRMASAEELARVWKHRILGPDRQGAYQGNNFSEPRLLHLRIHWKVLNSLTWDSWFSLITIIFWCSDYLLFDAKLLYNLSHPQIIYVRVTWDAVSWTWSPKITHWIKHISQLLGCT